MSELLKGIKLPERREVESSKKPVFEVKTYDTVLGADAGVKYDKTPAVSPAPGTPASPAPAKAVDAAQAPKVLVPVHTLKDDLQQVVHDQKISVVRAVSLEEQRRHRDKSDEAVEEAPKPRRSGRFGIVVLASGLLVLLGGGALLGVYLSERARSAPIQSPQTSSILFAESTVAFPLDNQSPNVLKGILAQARTSSTGALGSITQVAPTFSVTATDGSQSSRPATFSEFMRAIGAHPSDDLLRALSNDFFFGIHTVDENAPVIVIPVLSYDRAFAGMLAWESTMNADLAPIFTTLPSQTVDVSGLPVPRVFTDIIMRNYDVRALKDDSGTIQLYYSFPTQNYLVIAESPYSFTEVLSRLQAERKL